MHYQGHKIILTDERACRVCHKKIGNRSVLGVLRPRSRETGGPGDWEGIPVMGYMKVPPPPKKLSFSCFRYTKGEGFYKLRYLKMKGNFLFSYFNGRKDAPYWLFQLKVFESCILSVKMGYKRIKGWTLGWSIPLGNFVEHSPRRGLRLLSIQRKIIHKLINTCNSLSLKKGRKQWPWQC